MKRESLFTQYYKNIVKSTFDHKMNDNQFDLEHPPIATYQDEEDPQPLFHNYFREALENPANNFNPKNKRFKVFGVSQKKNAQVQEYDFSDFEKLAQKIERSIEQDQNLLESQTLIEQRNASLHQDPKEQGLSQDHLSKLLEISSDQSRVKMEVSEIKLQQEDLNLAITSSSKQTPRMAVGQIGQNLNQSEKNKKVCQDLEIEAFCRSKIGKIQTQFLNDTKQLISKDDDKQIVIKPIISKEYPKINSPEVLLNSIQQSSMKYQLQKSQKSQKYEISQEKAYKAQMDLKFSRQSGGQAVSSVNKDCRQTFGEFQFENYQSPVKKINISTEKDTKQLFKSRYSPSQQIKIGCNRDNKQILMKKNKEKIEPSHFQNKNHKNELEKIQNTSRQEKEQFHLRNTNSPKNILSDENNFQAIVLHHKQRIQKIVSPTNSEQKKERPFVPLPKKEQPRSSHNSIKKYIHNQKNYDTQIQKLIQKCEKVTELKEKEDKIKRQLNYINNYPEQKIYSKEKVLKSVKKPSQRIGYQQKDYYFPDYAVQKRKNNKQIEKSYSADKNILPNSILQHQLVQNVANMEMIIQNFKQISKQIDKNEHEENVGSKHINQKEDYGIFRNKHNNNRKSLLNEIVQFSKGYNKKHQPKIKKNRSLSKIDILNFTQKIGNRSKEEKPLLNSVNFTNYIRDQNESLEDNAKGLENVRLMNKNTARTEKRPSTISIYSQDNRLSEDNANSPKTCQYTHQMMLNQIKLLNKKIEKLEQQRKQSIKSFKSEQFDKRQEPRQHEHHVQLQTKSIEEDFQSYRNHSIPQQKIQNYQQLNGRVSKNNEGLSSKNLQRNGKLSSKQKQKITIQNQIEPRLIHQVEQQKPYERCTSILSLKDEPNFNINFPTFSRCPLKQHCQQQLTQIGLQMYKKLNKFVKKRGNLKGKKQIGDIMIKKYYDCVHFSTNNPLDYHLIYYFKGKVYFGEWSSEGYNQGCKQGFGYYYNPKKYIYEGQFDEDKKHGKGLINYPNNQNYWGHWHHGKKSGYGILMNAEGDVFKGLFKNGKKNGIGEERLSNGDYYRGEFKQGKLEGTGIYNWADGSVYKGQFQDGLLHGKGIWKSKQKDYYEGEYRKNQKHGYGKYKWKNGIVYEGYFSHGKQVGRDHNFVSPSQNVKQKLQDMENFRENKKDKKKRNSHQKFARSPKILQYK